MAADDVHFVGVRDAYFRAVDLFSRPRRCYLRIQFTQLQIRLCIRIVIFPSWDAETAWSSPSDRCGRRYRHRNFRVAKGRRRPGWWLVVAEPFNVCAAITSEPCLDPIDGFAIA